MFLIFIIKIKIIFVEIKTIILDITPSYLYIKLRTVLKKLAAMTHPYLKILLAFQVPNYNREFVMEIKGSSSIFFHPSRHTERKPKISHPMTKFLPAQRPFSFPYFLHIPCWQDFYPFNFHQSRYPDSNPIPGVFSVAIQLNSIGYFLHWLIQLCSTKCW